MTQSLVRSRGTCDDAARKLARATPESKNVLSDLRPVAMSGTAFPGKVLCYALSHRTPHMQVLEPTRFPIEYEPLSGRGLVLELTGLFGAPELSIDGKRLKSEGSWRRCYMVNDNLERQVSIRLKRKSILDAVPVVEIDGIPWRVARPLKRHEQIAIALPSICIVALAAISGGIARGQLLWICAIVSTLSLNARIMRSNSNTRSKLGMMILASMVLCALAFLGR